MAVNRVVATNTLLSSLVLSKEDIVLGGIAAAGTALVAGNIVGMTYDTTDDPQDVYNAMEALLNVFEAEGGGGRP